ncbi:hypothetical protein V8E55_011434 [Tylopilus felleus]
MILETLGRYRGYKELIVHHHDLSRLMSLDRCALCHLLDMECGYRDMLAKPSSSVNYDATTDDHVSGVDVQAAIQFLADEAFAAPDSVHHHAVVDTPSAVANEHHDSDAKHVNVQPAAQNNRAPCPIAFCQWRDGPLQVCGVEISCENVPAHFKEIHGIKMIHESCVIGCRWQGCQAQPVRKNFARHIRESHLNHTRDKGH